MDVNKLELEIQEIMNSVRRNPKSLIPELNDFKANFVGKYYKIPETNISIVTHEGAAAVIDAIHFLSEAPPCQALVESKGLYLAARDHAKDLGSTGNTSHLSKNGFKMNDRIEQYGEWDKSIAENIIFDDFNARDIVFGMIIDDGNPNRGHRKNIFNSDFHFCGVACSPHLKHKWVTVIDFAVDFEERPSSSSQKQHSNDENYQAKLDKKTKTSKPQNLPNIQGQKFNMKVIQPHPDKIAKDSQSDRNRSPSPVSTNQKELVQTQQDVHPINPIIQNADNQNNIKNQVINPRSKVLVASSGLNPSDDTLHKANVISNSISRKENNNAFDLNQSSNDFYDFLNDPDRPVGAVSAKVKKHIKLKGKRKMIKTTKQYMMETGDPQIIELIEFEFV